MKSDEVAKAFKAIARKRLCQNIRKLVVCRDIGDGDVTIRLSVSNLVTFNINVFGLLVKNCILHQSHRKLIVTIQGSR